jgi:glucose-1-phosphate adenylyltransferase
MPVSASTSHALTFILAGGEGRRLSPLTLHRAKPAVPFGGIYRLIDFTISNCVNSRLRQIHVLAQYQCESLQSHVRALGPGISARGYRDEFLDCLCPAPGKSYRGTADAVFQNLQLIEGSGAEFVVILSGDHVYRMDYRELLRFHSDCGADVTIAGVEYPQNAASQFGVLVTDSAGHVVNFEEKPKEPKIISAKPSKSLVSMGVYVFKTQALIHMLSDDARLNTSHDFGKNIIPRMIHDNAVSVYNFTELGARLGSYWRDVGTVDTYFHASMELPLSLSFDPYTDRDWPLYSCGADLAVCGEEGPSAMSSVPDSVVSRGVSLARGSRVIHSILSPQVEVDRLSDIEHSILLQGVRVGERVRIRRAIIDENVIVGDGVEIGYEISKDRKYGVVTDSGIVVIPANTHIKPSRTSFWAFPKWRTEVVKSARVGSQRQERIHPTTVGPEVDE